MKYNYYLHVKDNRLYKSDIASGDVFMRTGLNKSEWCILWDSAMFLRYIDRHIQDKSYIQLTDDEVFMEFL